MRIGFKTFAKMSAWGTLLVCFGSAAQPSAPAYSKKVPSNYQNTPSSAPELSSKETKDTNAYVPAYTVTSDGKIIASKPLPSPGYSLECDTECLKKRIKDLETLVAAQKEKISALEAAVEQKNAGGKK